MIVFKRVYEWWTGKPYDAVVGEVTEWAAAVAIAAAKLEPAKTGTTTAATAVEAGTSSASPTAPSSTVRKRAGHGAVATVGSTAAWIDVLARSQANGTAVVVKFTAEWCAPCKRIAPVFTELASTDTTAHFIEVDVDAVADVFKGAGAASLPTFQVYRGSMRVATMSGANEADLKKLVADNV
jgi:thioredoxin 1